MATEVKIPDLGEGIEDVTVSRWRVKVGDSVSEGEVIVEIATDKVDTEVAATASGKILKIGASEGDIIPLTQVLAVIGAEGESAESADAAPAGDVKVEPKSTENPARNEENVSATTPATTTATEVTTNGDGTDVKASPVAKRVAADKGVDLADVSGTGPGGRITKDDVLASSDKPKGTGDGAQAAALPGDLADEAPLEVRRLAADYNLNLREVAGGRPLSTLTRYDVLSAVASRDAGKDVVVEARFATPSGWSQTAAAPAASSAPASKSAEAKSESAKAAAPAEAGAREELVKHSRMRAAVARTTGQSAFTAPHVTTMWDVEMTAVLAHRAAHKKEFAAAGVNLTITAYFFEAALAGLRAVPAANSSWTDEGVLIKRYYNLGMATALPADKYGMGGLIVPVIKNAGDLNLLGIARAVNELAEKARGNQLKQDDLADGTFTISNYGTSGSRFQTPIIVQPQVGILGVGAVEKRAIVVSAGHPLEANAGDYLTFRPMTTLGFSYDHRVLDGATADAFCAAVKAHLESYK